MKIGRKDVRKSKTALVTGASSGIGEATARRLAMAGYKVYGTSRRGARGGLRPFDMPPLDVTSDESVEAAVKEVIRLEGRLDLLVNNAGSGVAPAGAEESSIEQARSIFETNFFGIVRMTRAVVLRVEPELRHAKRRLVNGTLHSELRAISRWVVCSGPLNQFDTIAIGVGNEEPIGPGYRRRLFRCNAVLAEVGACGSGVVNSQREMARTDAVWPILQQEVQMLFAQVVPDDHEVEGSRLGDFLEAEDLAVEPTATSQISD
jgi:NAD(P)-dependent dehydrogenase (short-subunit alcohol dehydrogenase family)